MNSRLKPLAEKLGRLGVAFFLLLAVYLVLYFLAPASGFTLLAALAFYVTGALYATQIVRRNLRRLIWRLRNRLIVAYLYIAFVPIALIVVLVGLAGWALVGQIAVYLVSSELDRRTAALNGAAKMLAAEPAAELRNTVREITSYLRDHFPNVELLIRNKQIYRYPDNSTLSAPPAGWNDTSGLVMKDGKLSSWAHVTQGETEVTLIAPLTPELLADLVPGLGEVFLLDVGSNTAVATSAARKQNKRVARFPGPSNRFDPSVYWPRPVYFQYWDPTKRPGNGALLVHTRPSIVLGEVFGQVDFAQNVFLAFVFVFAVLILVWLISLILGVSLTRTITGAVHNLYEGTERVRAGDFSHRIKVEGHDQLAELGHSFNSMTENLERLIVVEKEQERLKSEIEIAREVQGQLFPRSAPAMRTLELTGVCHPARMVSGDYYDFVRLGDANLALAIGDVAGKGISAALLMAAIQSSMRAQLTAGIRVHAAASHAGGNGGGNAVFSAAELVSQLNRQVYANTSPEKYATFYFGLYDDDSRLLTYTNAGHPPPIVMRHGHAERLKVTGTVVGAFPSAVYEEASMELRCGDLLVAFTDGIVEPENEYGEAFGEDRLIDLLVRYGERESKDIIARVMETVEQWTGSSELFDDMTVILARGV